MSRGRARLRNYNQAIIQATDLTNTLTTTPLTPPARPQPPSD